MKNNWGLWELKKKSSRYMQIDTHGRYAQFEPSRYTGFVVHAIPIDNKKH